MRPTKKSLLPLLVALTLSACGEGREAERVSVPVRSSGSAIGVVTTDLGYAVTLRRAELPIRDLQFTARGEGHASFWRRATEVLLPAAHAHPGHGAGGEAIGELPGSHLLRFGEAGPVELGEATMLSGTYGGLSFTFDEGTSRFEGVAEKEGQSWDFVIELQVGAGRRMVGGAFDVELAREGNGAVEVRLLPQDPFAAATLFDLIDFETLPVAGTGSAVTLTPGSDEETALIRALQSHAFYAAEVIP